MIDSLGENLVFLLGVPRSGTTLLSAMLDRHPQVLCPPEPWIMLALSALGQIPPAHPADPQLLGDATRAFFPAAFEARLTHVGHAAYTGSLMQAIQVGAPKTSGEP